MDELPTLLYCPDAIPSSSWVRDQILWADSLAAFWPGEEPTPVTQLQEQSLADIRVLRERGIFDSVNTWSLNLEDAASRLAAVPRDEANTNWGLTSSLTVESGSDSGELYLDERDAQSFLHYGKFSDALRQRLEQSGVIAPAPSGTGLPPGHFEALPGGVSSLLMQAAASFTQVNRGYLAVPGNPLATAQLAQPKSTSSPKGTAFALPALPTVRRDIPIQELVELTAEPGFQRARQDYVDHLTELWRALQRTSPDLASGQYLEQMAGELERASRPIWGRVRSWGERAHLTRGNSIVLALGAGEVAVDVLTQQPSAAFAVGGLLTAAVVAIRQGTPPFARTISRVVEKPSLA